MIKSKKSILMAACLSFSSLVMATDTVNPETLNRVFVSSTDVNRIKCGDGVISGIHYSTDKNLLVDTKESNAYVKFQALKKGDEMIYSERASEMFVTCGGEVYELILIPKVMNAKTIYLSNPIKNRIQATIEEYGQLPLEEQIVRFSLALLTDDQSVLQSFMVSELNSDQQGWFKFDSTAKVGKLKEFKVDGVGLKVSEYSVISDKNRRFNPTEFLDTRIGDNILGVTLDPEVAYANNPIKLIVVEKEVDNGF